MAGHAVEVAGVGTGDGVEDEQRVFNEARHGAEFVERPAEGHGAGARDAAVGGAEAGDAAAHGGADDAAAGFAADGEGDEAGGGGGSGTCAGSGRAFFESQGFMVWPPNQMSLRASAPMLSLAMSTAPACVEAVDDGGVSVGDAVAEGLGAVGGGDAGGVEQVLCAPGNAVERAAIMAGGNFSVGAAGLLESVIGQEGDDAAELWIEAAGCGRDKCW